MINWILKTFVSTFVVFFISWILPGVSIEQSYLTALFVAILLAVLNSTLKPILVLFTLPATILSLGLFMGVINAMVVLSADFFIDNFTVDNFWWALIFSVLYSFFNSYLQQTVFPEDKKRVFSNVNNNFTRKEKSSTTVSGNTIKVENGKKTIIIEKN